MLNRPFLELGRVFLLRDLFHLLPPKSNVNCTSPLEDYLSGEPHFDYPPDIRRVIYTTNAIESLNMGLRKVTKNRGSFPSDEALIKLFYLAQQNISRKWTLPIRDWKAALNRFTIQFGDRMPQH
jgi:transposase-like protein